jgi:di/tricarboxylate transporter
MFQSKLDQNIGLEIFYLLGTSLGLGTLNFVLRFYVMMFTLAPPSNKTSSTMFFPTCT